MIGDLNGSFGSRQFLTLQMKREFSEFGSFHVVVLQRTANKCKKSYNARAQPLFWAGFSCSKAG